MIDQNEIPEDDAGSARVKSVEVTNVPVTDDALTAFAAADGVLDFTAPAATVAFAELAAQARIVHVVGTTGLSEEDFAKLKAASYHARIVQSGNMSLGINLMAALVRRVAKALGDEFDIEIAEMHHRMKVDAPSGTALMLGEAAAEGRGVLDTGRTVRRGHVVHPLTKGSGAGRRHERAVRIEHQPVEVVHGML